MPRLVPSNICLPERTGMRYSRDHAYDWHQRLDYLIACISKGAKDDALLQAGAAQRDINTAREIVQKRGR